MEKSRSLSTSLIAGQGHLPSESESCHICPRIRAVLVDDQKDRPGRHEDDVHLSQLAGMYSVKSIFHHPVEKPI